MIKKKKDSYSYLLEKRPSCFVWSCHIKTLYALAGGRVDNFYIKADETHMNNKQCI